MTMTANSAWLKSPAGIAVIQMELQLAHADWNLGAKIIGDWLQLLLPEQAHSLSDAIQHILDNETAVRELLKEIALGQGTALDNVMGPLAKFLRAAECLQKLHDQSSIQRMITSDPVSAQ